MFDIIVYDIQNMTEIIYVHTSLDIHNVELLTDENEYQVFNQIH